MSALFALALALLASPSFAAIPDGTYRQGCQAGYQREEVFTGEYATYVEKNYADTQCRELSLEIRSYGQLTYGDAVTLPPGASAIDFEFVRVGLVPKQEWVAALYRERKLCGRAEWALNEETDITGRACDFYGVGRFAQVPESGSVRFGVYLLEKDGLLYFGKLRPERDGGAPERRPQELDPFPYMRQ